VRPRRIGHARPDAAFELCRQLCGLGGLAVEDPQFTRAEAASANAIALPTPPAPIRATAPCEEALTSGPAARGKPGRIGVVASQAASRTRWY